MTSKKKCIVVYALKAGRFLREDVIFISCQTNKNQTNKKTFSHGGMEQWIKFFTAPPKTLNRLIFFRYWILYFTIPFFTLLIPQEVFA